MGAELSVFAAFAAGLFSFLSPCVLPLIPSFLSVLGGFRKNKESGTETETAGGASASRFFIAAAGFVTGFSCVFVMLGILFAGAGVLLAGINRIINIIAGILIIILGLNILFNFFSFLNYEKRFHAARRPRGIFGAFLAGAAFGAGWSPCIGPILGSILLLAGASAQPARAAVYLAIYSAGLGLPFLAAALFFDKFKTRFTTLKSWIPALRTASALFLVLMGILILAGRFASLNAFFLKTGYAIAVRAESGSPWARFVPAVIFFLAAAFPCAVYLRKKSLPPLAVKLCCAILLLLGIAQAAGLINCAAVISRWFLYQGL